MVPADNNNLAPEAGLAGETVKKPLSPAAKRALEEAEARRKAEETKAMPPEIGGRGGADPSRFGDWEIKGRAIDF